MTASASRARVGIEDVDRQMARLDELLAAWAAEHARRRSAKHVADARAGVTALLAELRVTEVRDVTIAGVLTWRARATGSTRTINRRLGYLVTLLRWALASGRISRNPLDGYQPLPVREADRVTRRHVLTHAEVGRLLEAARAWDRRHPSVARMAVLPEILYGTGMRPSEAYRLSWGDWDAAAGTIRVAPGKTGRGRTLPVPERLGAILRETRSRRGVARGKDVDPIIVGPRWARLTAERGVIGRIWAEWLEIAGLPAVCPDGTVIDRESLRHTYAHRLKDGGVPRSHAQQLMGHTSGRMLDEVYGQADVATSWTPPDPPMSGMSEMEGLV
ncbi:MAG: tyrosine-type recombinase/integrase [Gemmatimonadales bacterium]